MNVPISSMGSCTTMLHYRHHQAQDGQTASLFGVGVCGSGRWIWLIACFVWRGLCYLRGHSSWGELKADSPCSLCCLESWVPITTMGTLLLTCLCWSEGFEAFLYIQRREKTTASPFPPSLYIIPLVYLIFFLFSFSFTQWLETLMVRTFPTPPWHPKGPKHREHRTTGTYHWPWPLSPLALHCMCVLTWTWYWEVSCIMMLELEYFFLCSVRNKKRNIGCFYLDLRITSLSLSHSPQASSSGSTGIASRCLSRTSIAFPWALSWGFHLSPWPAKSF